MVWIPGSQGGRPKLPHFCFNRSFLFRFFCVSHFSHFWYRFQITLAILQLQIPYPFTVRATCAPWKLTYPLKIDWEVKFPFKTVPFQGILWCIQAGCQCNLCWPSNHNAQAEISGVRSVQVFLLRRSKNKEQKTTSKSKKTDFAWFYKKTSHTLSRTEGPEIRTYC